MIDKELNVHSGVELSLLSTDQLDQVSIVDLHTSLLVEDAENIPLLVQKLSDEKFLALIDLSSWEKDKFSAMNFATWLKVILSMDLDASIIEIKRLDKQELSLFMSNVLEVRWYDADQIYEGDPILTQDRVFVIFSKLQEDGKTEHELEEIANKIINIAYLDEGMQLGRQICMDIMRVVYSAQEEEAYRIKNGRLADEGIPTYIDALELFYFEDPSKLLKKILKTTELAGNKKSSPSQDYIISSFTVVPRSYWDSISKFSDELLQDLQVELSALLTSSIVVNNVLAEDSKHIKEVIDRSKSYFNLGMELIKENANVSLEDLLNFVKLREIFRLGFSLLIDIKRNASKIKIAAEALNRPDILNPDEKEFIDHLLSTIPMFQKTIDVKPVAFEKLDQLKEARQTLSSIAERMVGK
ncbi:MAG: DUF6178 family protein [bacterium]